MRHRTIPLLATIGIIAMLALVGTKELAGAQDETVPVDATPNTCDERTATAHYRAAHRTVKAGWAIKNWRDGPKSLQRLEVRDHISCLERRKDRDKVKNLVATAHRKLVRYRTLRSVTNYNCGGRWSWWAIECYIISCESGFSWGAANPSGAVGPYQLLGWGAPFPVSGWSDKMRHHRIANSLWGGPGDSDWTQCL